MELKQKLRGSSFGTLMPHSGHAIDELNSVSVVLAVGRLQADQHQPVGQLQRARNRGREPARVEPGGRRRSVRDWLGRIRLQNDAVDDGLEGVVLALLQPHALFDFGDLAVDAYAIALLVERLESLRGTRLCVRARSARSR